MPQTYGLLFWLGCDEGSFESADNTLQLGCVGLASEVALVVASCLETVLSSDFM